MKWSNEEIESLEWLVKRDEPLQSLKNILYERTSESIVGKIRKMYPDNSKKYVTEHNQESHLKERQKDWYINKQKYKDIEYLDSLCDYLILNKKVKSKSIEIYGQLRNKNPNFKINYLEPIIYLACKITNQAPKIKKLSKDTGMNATLLMNHAKKYSDFLGIKIIPNYKEIIKNAYNDLVQDYDINIRTINKAIKLAENTDKTPQALAGAVYLANNKELSQKLIGKIFEVTENPLKEKMRIIESNIICDN